MISTATGNVARGNLLDDVIFSTLLKLVLTGSFSPTIIKQSNTSTYHLSLNNIGGLHAASNQVTILLPKESSYIAGTTLSNEHYDEVSHKITFTLGTIIDNALSQMLLGNN